MGRHEKTEWHGEMKRQKRRIGGQVTEKDGNKKTRQRHRAGGDRETRGKKKLERRRKKLEVKVREDLESEWHSRVSSASDSRCGEQVLNIKATQQRTWANGPYWYGTSQAGTHTQSHTHSHARMQIYRHHRRVASHHSGRAKQKEHACLIHNLPFQHVRVLILRTVTPNPQPPRSIPHTPRCRNSKRGDEQGWQRMSEHI